MSFASVSLAMRASYSTSLLVERKLHRTACWTKSPSKEVRTSPMPEVLVPLILLTPSTKSVHLDVERSVKLSNSLSACAAKSTKKLAIKSARTYDLSTVCGWKVIPYSFNSMAHLVSRQKSLGLCSMLFRG